MTWRRRFFIQKYLLSTTWLAWSLVLHLLFCSVGRNKHGHIHTDTHAHRHTESNVFMANFEAKYIYSYIKETSLLYLSTLDILTTWLWYEKAQKPSQLHSLKKLNDKHKTIKSEFQISRRKIPFFDSVLYKDENNIQTTLYHKPTYRQAFWQAESENPKISKKKHSI